MATIEHPIGIIIAQPAAFFRQYNEQKWLAKMQELNTRDDAVWYREMKNLPTQDFLYIYTCYNGKLQFRTNYGGSVRKQDLKFPRPEGGIRTFNNANAIIHTGPFVKCPVDIDMKGFQGFKYTDKELW